MKKQIRVSTLLGSMIALLAPVIVFAQGLVPPPAFEGTAEAPLEIAIVQIVNWFLVLAGLIATVFLVLGGVKFITSQGNTEQAESAKNTILYAVIGLLVIILSAAIVRFVVQAGVLTG